jgi:peptide/nickel transport system permease protein
MRFPAILLITLVLLVCAAPLLTQHDPSATDATTQLLPPSLTHLFGTDYLGRDVFSRTLWGGQRTLLIAFIATWLAAIPGSVIGIMAGTSRIANLLTLLINTLLALPPLLLALVILSLLDKSWLTLALAVGLAQLPAMARVARSAAQSAYTASFVEAAHAQGAGYWHILRRHIFPSMRATLLTYAGVTFSYAILNGAALSLLGLGGDPGAPDWGVMLADGRASFRLAPWMALAPGMAITLVILSVNALIDHINARQG